MPALELHRFKYIPVLVVAIDHLNSEIWAWVLTPLETLRHLEHILPTCENRVEVQMSMHKWVG
jgi:hypothetical protein